MNVVRKYHVVVYGFDNTPQWSWLASSLMEAVEYRRKVMDIGGEADVKYRLVFVK